MRLNCARARKESVNHAARTLAGMHRRAVIAGLGAALAAALLAPVLAQAEERRVGGGESYITVDAVAGTVMRFGQRRGVLTVQLGIDVPNAALRARAAASVPRLRAAYAQVVQTYAAGLPAGALPDAEWLSRELQRQTDRVLGVPGARLLLGSIIVN